MPSSTTSTNTRLGLFVAAGLTCLLGALFLLGRKQNLFSSSLEVKADFRNVAGLLTGNNVRLAGIDVGTVKRIQILNDSTVRVVMELNKEVQPFVRRNAVASVGTDGLVGNTIVNLTGVAAPAPPVAAGDILRTTTLPGIEKMMRTFDISNKNLVDITHDLRQITGKLNGSDALWRLLSDEQVAADVRGSLRSVAAATATLQASAVDVQQLTRGVRAGRGAAGYLLTDTALAGQLRHAGRQLARTSDTLAGTLTGLKRQIQTGPGPLNTLLADTTMTRQLRQSMQNVEEGTAGFSQSMEALQHNFLVRGYLRRHQKKEPNKAPTVSAHQPNAKGIQ